MDAGTIKLGYNIEMITKDVVTGEVKDRSEIKNMIVNTGLARVAKLLNGVETTYMRAIAIGTGNTAVTATDTELDVEVTRATATLTYSAVGGFKAVFSKVFTFTSGESYTIKEVGVFDSLITSSATMFNRALDTGKIVDVDTSLTINVTITCA